jgi:hypothetical protein
LDASIARELTVRNSKMLDTWLHPMHRTRGAASVALATARLVPSPSEGATIIFVCGAINRSGGQTWLVLGTLGT